MFPFAMWNGLRQIIKLRVFFGVLFIYGGHLGAEQQISAGWVETKLDQLGHSRTYVGQVAFEDAVNRLKIDADSAVVREGQYLFLSNLHFADSLRTIKANRLTYDSVEGFAQFVGDVSFREGQRFLRADNVDVWPDSERVRAWGNTVVDLKAQAQRIIAQEVTLGAKGEWATATGAVVATVSNESNNPLEILTDSLRFLPEEERIWFVGASKIRQLNFALSTHAGYYAGNLLHAFEQPKVLWVESDLTDSVRATSDSMVVQLEDHVVNRLHLFVGAELNLWGGRDSLRYLQSIQGDSIIAKVQDQKLSTIYVFGKPQLHFQREGLDIEIRGDSLTVWFNDGRLDSLVVMGQCEGTYLAENEGLSEISGDKKTLWFLADELAKMRVDGSAQCRYAPMGDEAGSHVDVGGDILNMLFDAGNLTHLNAEGHVRGEYFQQELDKKP